MFQAFHLFQMIRSSNKGERQISSNPLLSIKNIQKDFYGNKVLEDISFDLDRGEIVGLVGENGAGKSTLMNILFGMPVIQKTGGYKGTVQLNGKDICFRDPVDAIEAGIGMVHQEFFLIPSFTATENILLNRESTQYNFLVELFGDRLQKLDRTAMKERAIRAIQTLGVDIHPDTLVSEMPVSYKQFTEIAREIDREQMKVLVLDEPTAVMTESEASTFLTAMKRLAARGIGQIFISHRLHEILEVCDKIVVLRDGKVIKNIPASEATLRNIASWMVGREVGTTSFRRARSADDQDTSVLLSIDKLKVDMPGERVKNVSLEVREGEILGIGGLAGQGKLGIANGIMGLYPAQGSIILNGKPLPLNNPLESLKAGVAFISEDRRGVGLLLNESLKLNIAFTAMQVKDRFIKRLPGGIKWQDWNELDASAKEFIDRLEIRCTGPDQRVVELSGGNQQKVCVAKVLAMEPKLLLASEPTRGIDIGAKQLVLEVLREFNQRDRTTIVMTSSELQELRSICDRIAIVYEGEIVGIVPADAPMEDIGLLMLGNKLVEEPTHA
jgi:simple sugar transport system ATP-binding protein